VAVYFCDSRAIVKGYVQKRGSPWMVTLLDAAAMNHLYLARIAGVEVITAMRRRARFGDIVATGVAAALAQFRQDFAGRTVSHDRNHLWFPLIRNSESP
jgi:predicted nucleic acid-binding protein